jgi:hypothetical protein
VGAEDKSLGERVEADEAARANVHGQNRCWQYDRNICGILTSSRISTSISSPVNPFSSRNVCFAASFSLRTEGDKRNALAFSIRDVRSEILEDVEEDVGASEREASSSAMLRTKVTCY